MQRLVTQFPLLTKLIKLNELSWFNPKITSLQEALPFVGLDDKDIKDASDRLQRFAPYLKKAFPETAATNGIIESEVIEIFKMKTKLIQQYKVAITGKLLLKKDSHLPISGSIKARGGIYEVLIII